MAAPVEQEDELFFFTWDVHPEGYRWVRGRTNDQPKPQTLLTDGNPHLLGLSASSLHYEPLRHTGLFRTFAATSPTKEGILAFAQQYGMLGGMASTEAAIEDPDTQCQDTYQVEPLKTWIDEITDMNRALTLWDMVQQGDTKGLRQFIRWGLDHVEYQGPHVTTKIAGRHVRPELWKRIDRGDVIKPAQYYIQQVVNKRNALVSPRLLWDSGHTAMQLYLRPDGLLSALWLQFAQAVSGNKRYRHCQECGTAYVIGTAPLEGLRAGRSDRLFCSDACRMKAYRKRKSTTGK